MLKKVNPHSVKNTSRLKKRCPMNKQICIIFTTFDNKEEALKISKQLLDRKLIACAQISGPITSVYRWQETIEEAQEFKLAVKTFTSKCDLVIDTLAQLHSYDVPEILVQTVEKSLKSYLEWMTEEIQ